MGSALSIYTGAAENRNVLQRNILAKQSGIFLQAKLHQVHENVVLVRLNIA